MRYALADGMPAHIAQAAAALGQYYLWQGHSHEGIEAFAAALEATANWNGAPEQQRLRATLMLWHAVFCHHEGQGAAQAAIETSLALLDAAEHAGVEARPEWAFGLWQLARIQASRGDGTATALLRQAVALYRALDLSWELGMVLADLGDHLRDEGCPDEAGEALREAQTIGERAGDEHGLARILQRRSQICLETGDPEEAEGLARRGCELARRAGGPPDLAAALGGLGVVLMHRHNQGEAELRASLALYAELNEPAPLALAECRLALCLLHRGRLAEGLERAHRAVAGGAQAGEAVQALLALGLGQWAAGDLAAAGASMEAGITLCRQHGLTTTLGLLLAARSGLAQDDPRQARAWAREALRIALERRNRLLLALVFTNAAGLLLALGRPERAAEAHALDAAGPFWGASELIAPQRAATLATLRATLDPGTLAAALDRGRALDPWTAAGQLAEELAVAQ
ncbi:MAG: tetratricopeptide repeat protein [Chloroflexaceae bacterium]|nr:tetratricopeptide repeat protein [Chloroflexaceae bacterium]